MIFGAPPIVTNGLVLNLDAGNSKSYPGSGTTWSDLSGNSNTGTLTNGPTFSGDGGGSLVLNGTTQYVDLPSTTTYTFGTGNFTISFWLKTTDTDFNVINPKTSTGAGFWGLLHQASKLRWNNSYNVTNLWEVNNTTTLLDNKWHHIAIVRNISTVTVYYDTITQSLTSTTDNTNYSGQDAMRMGSGNLSPLNGSISQFSIYNRSLSASEVQQNYNALKSRFNLS